MQINPLQILARNRRFFCYDERMKIVIGGDKTIIEFEPEETVKLIDPSSPDNLKLLIESIAKLRDDQIKSEILITTEKARLDLEVAEKLKALEANNHE